MAGLGSIELAQSLGVDVNVTITTLCLRSCQTLYAIVHLNIAERGLPFKHLAGCGGWQIALLEEVQVELDLVAIGTIADMVSPTENRTWSNTAFLCPQKHPAGGLQDL